MKADAILSPSTGWLLLALFSVVWIALGWFWGRKAKTLDGYMILAGGEMVIAPMWTLGAEYSWTRYDTFNMTQNFAAAPNGPARHELTVDPDVHAFKVRLNFRPLSK